MIYRLPPFMTKLCPYSTDYLPLWPNSVLYYQIGSINLHTMINALVHMVAFKRESVLLYFHMLFIPMQLALYFISQRHTLYKTALWNGLFFYLNETGDEEFAVSLHGEKLHFFKRYWTIWHNLAVWIITYILYTKVLNVNRLVFLSTF